MFINNDDNKLLEEARDFLSKNKKKLLALDREGYVFGWPSTGACIARMKFNDIFETSILNDKADIFTEADMETMRESGQHDWPRIYNEVNAAATFISKAEMIDINIRKIDEHIQNFERLLEIRKFEEG